MESLWQIIIALVPSIGVGFLFYVVIKNMLEGDRKERLAHARWDAEHGLSPAAARVESAEPLPETEPAPRS